MKKLNKYITPILFAFAVVSCTNLVEDINEDPNKLSANDAQAKNIFQSVLLANQYFQTTNNVRNTMLWLGQGTGVDRQYIPLNDWNNNTSADSDSAWDLLYVNFLTQARITQDKAIEENNFKMLAALQIVEANSMGTATSLWGDIPYSEFTTNNPNNKPKFDKQSTVYAKLQTLLDDAIANLGKAGSIPSALDIYYGGSTAKWTQLAYSLKARYYLHVKNYPLARANALLGINAPANDFKALFYGTTSQQNFNPFYEFLEYERQGYMDGTGYAVTVLNKTSTKNRTNSKTDETARLAFIYTGTELNINGLDNGLETGRFGSDSNMPLVTYGEMLLIIAEADARTSFAAGLTSYNTYRALLNTRYSIGNTNGGYEGLAYKYDPYVAADFASAGMENATGSLTNQNALLREIYEERYIYFIGNYEAFTDYRRTNNIAEIKINTLFTGTPQRLIYSQDEINANAANIPSPFPKATDKTEVHN
ncbi:SusD/RagB family nutrient-binding outer membrane lipoprotein [Flavobacterium sp. LS2P90]|uniref:SusD/RagB family nutrient-binding outer membrane lipoprotein n=1 Tax=Flavobacterium xylosi TaxID=3230415 RepID=A0ABW6HWW0_9FLAO